MSAEQPRASLLAASAFIIIALVPAKAETTIAPVAPPRAGVGDTPSKLEISAAFLAEAFPNVHFLDASSRMAIAHSTNAKVREFAQRVAKQEIDAGATLMHWIRTAGAVATDPSSSSARLAIRLKAPRMLPSQAGALQRLSTLQGRDFDQMFISSDKEALERLATVYQDFVAKGGDAGLQAVAARQLPEVKQLISALDDF